MIGKVLDALDGLELTRNTVVVLWGDHGWHLGDHGLWCKHSNYEQAARIPLMMAGPGIAQGRAAGLVETVDLYPTLAELAGLPARVGLDGRSLVPQLRDPAAPGATHVLHCYPRSGGLIGRALRTPTQRLVEWKVPGAAADSAVVELYDYEKDAGEEKNLAASAPETVAALRTILRNHYPEAKPQLKAAAARSGGRKADDE
jgi:iduronate 2-sulfatase